MGDLINIAECLSCVAAVALSVFVIIFQRNISSENWFVSKKKMMLAASPFALISFSLGAYLTLLVNSEMEFSTTLSAPINMEMEMELSTTLSAPIQQPSVLIEADAVMSDRFTLLCAYITFLMGLVTLKTGWSSGLKRKIRLSIPFFTSLFAINLWFLQVLWELICSAPQLGPHSLTSWVFYCMLASWVYASLDMVQEMKVQKLVQIRKEVDIIRGEVGMILDLKGLEDASKRLAVLECELSELNTWNNLMSPAEEMGEQV